MSLTAQIRDLAYNPDHTRWMTPLLLVAEAALCGVIIDKVPCTLIHVSTPQTSPYVDTKHGIRHRNRLDNLYAADGHLS
jgi:hypothetical protein